MNTDKKSLTPAEQLERDYPAIEPAYQIAVGSYETSAKRLENIDGRIQTLLAFALGLCLAVTSIAKTENLLFESFWFLSGIILIILAVVLSVVARLTGKTKTLRPTHLYNHWLHLSPVEFRKNMIYYAGQDFDKNMALVLRKWRLSVASMIIFSLALVALVFWVSDSRRDTRHSAEPSPPAAAVVPASTPAP